MKRLLLILFAASSGFADGTAFNATFLVNNINSPVLRSAVVSPIAAGAGHIAGGTTANLMTGQNFGEAFINSFDGIGKSMAIGGAIGVSATVGMSYANGVNPWTGRPLTTGNTDNVSYHAEQRTIERSISQSDINDALKNPLKVSDMKYDAQGRPSVKYIGNKATVVINPETGNIITVHGTHTKFVQKLGGKK